MSRKTLIIKYSYGKQGSSVPSTAASYYWACGLDSWPWMCATMPLKLVEHVFSDDQASHPGCHPYSASWVRHEGHHDNCPWKLDGQMFLIVKMDGTISGADLYCVCITNFIYNAILHGQLKNFLDFYYIFI